MKFAKPCFDFGLTTDSIDKVAAFWRDDIGLPFNHELPLGPGHVQHRYDLHGSVLKLNSRKLDDTPPGGYRELLIARDDVTKPRELADPDGNRVTLVPRGHLGITQIGVSMCVRDLDAHRRFYATALKLPQVGENAFQAGEGVILLEHDPSVAINTTLWGCGWRYLTFQIWDAETEHAHVLAHGGREGMPITRFKDIAIGSMVLDPDGNWIELSQRANLTGPLGDRVSSTDFPPQPAITDRCRIDL